jgi:hypothetical protein
MLRSLELGLTFLGFAITQLFEESDSADDYPTTSDDDELLPPDGRRITEAAKRNRSDSTANDILAKKRSKSNLQPPAHLGSNPSRSTTVQPGASARQGSPTGIPNRRSISPEFEPALPGGAQQSTFRPVDAPEPKSRANDDQVPNHNRSAFKLAKDFLKCRLFTESPWPACHEDEFDLVERAWVDALGCMSTQQRDAGLLGASSQVWGRDGGPSRYIDSVTRGVV